MSDRINWGVVARMTPPEQYDHVKKWLDLHQPGDVGYKPAARWLARRDFWRRTLRNTQPAMEAAYAAFQERKRSR